MGFRLTRRPVTKGWSYRGSEDSRIQGFEVSRSQFQGFAGGEGFHMQVSRETERGGRESSRRFDLSPRRSEVSRFPGRFFFNFSKSVSRFKLPTPTPLIKVPRLKTQHPNSRTHDSHIITPYQTFLPPPSAYCVFYGYFL
jgi:hypothetical protein